MKKDSFVYWFFTQKFDDGMPVWAVPVLCIIVFIIGLIVGYNILKPLI